MGPYNTQMHRIEKLDEAFESRYEMINKIIVQQLEPKRTQLVA